MRNKYHRAQAEVVHSFHFVKIKKGMKVLIVQETEPCSNLRKTISLYSTTQNSLPPFISLKTKCIHLKKIFKTILRKTKLGDEEHVIEPKNKNHYNKRRAYLRLIRDSVPRDLEQKHEVRTCKTHRNSENEK